MSAFNRRRFLQVAGGSAIALGIHPQHLMQQGDRYGKVLAQSTPRKRALLVGINQYSGSTRFTPLQGCTTDAQLQRELLIHRFGFHPDDILVLSDETADQPTRTNILTAFEEHLIKPTRAGDVVVFHFSGHGSRVIEPNSPDGDDLNSTFVPADVSNDAQVVNDIMGRTLFLLTSALATDQVTVVLDSCYAGGGTRGNVRVRSSWDGVGYQPSAEELDYQRQWLQTRSIDFATVQRQRQVGTAKGVAIAAAQANQEALDVGFDGFYAGAFTYLLTQYLWHQVGSPLGTVGSITRDMQRLSRQVPLLDQAPNVETAQVDTYFVPGETLPSPAEGVVTQVEQNQATVWLGGLDPDSISAFSRGATLVPRGASAPVTVVERQGLWATVNLPQALPTGTLLSETTRVIPPDLALRIGLDPSIGAETPALQRALASLPRVVGIPTQDGPIPYEGEVHYILSRMTPDHARRFEASVPLSGAPSMPAHHTVGLFSQGLDAWVPNSFGGQATESAVKAVQRLQPKLQALLAARLLKSTLRANSARLDVSVAITTEGIGEGVELLAEAFTARGAAEEARPQACPGAICVDQDFRFRVINHEATELYISIVAFAEDGQVRVLLPRPQQGGQDQIAESRVAAGQTAYTPPESESAFYISERLRAEALVIVSRVPFVGALAQLQELAVVQAEGTRSEDETAALSLGAVGALLEEVGGGRNALAENSGNGNEFPVVPTTEIAAFLLPFEVV